MNRPVVLDASVALALILGERGFTEAHARLRSWREAGVRLHVPELFWLEVSNSLVRRHGLGSKVAFEAIQRLDDLGLATAEIDRPLTLLAIDLAERHGLSVYDALYLALAESLDADLCSADRGLLEVAGARGIPVVASAAPRRLAEERAPYEPADRPRWPSYREAAAYLTKLRTEAQAASAEGAGPRALNEARTIG